MYDGPLDGFTKALAKRRDIHREDALLYGDVVPDQVEKLTFGNQRPGVPDQRDEHIECLWRERHDLARVPQPALLDIQRVRAEFEHLTGASHGLVKS